MLTNRVYGPTRTKVRDYVNSKGGEEVTVKELRVAFPDIQTSGFTTLLAKMAAEGDIVRKYRGVYVAVTGVSAANGE